MESDTNNINLPTAFYRLIDVAKRKNRKKYFWSTIAVAKYKNTFVEGWNSNKTSPKFFYESSEKSYEKHSMYNRHAEAHVLQQLDYSWDRRKIKIYISRINQEGEISMSKPCPSCQIKMRREGVLAKNIYYINWDGEWECLMEYEYE